MTRREIFRQTRLQHVRRCAICSVILPPYQAGAYCERCGPDEPIADGPAPVSTAPCRGCGRALVRVERCV